MGVEGFFFGAEFRAARDPDQNSLPLLASGGGWRGSGTNVQMIAAVLSEFREIPRHSPQLPEIGFDQNF